MKKRPPFLPQTLISLFARYNHDHLMLGDLEEEYHDLAQSVGLFRAKLWYWKHALLSIPPYMLNTILWSFIMFRNYFKTAIRSLQRNISTSLINIFGLSLGITSCLIIFLFVQDEFSYNDFHKNADNIYRVYTKSVKFGRILEGNYYWANFEDDFDEIPGIDNFTKIHRSGVNTFKVNDDTFQEKSVFADKEIFNVLTFPLLNGDKTTALAEPYKVVLSSSFAKKLFGDENSLGKTIIYNNKYDLVVTGVVEDVPKNSDFQFETIISYKTLFAMYGPNSSIGRDTFVILEETASVKNIENQFNEVMAKHESKGGPTFEYFLQPLDQLHVSRLGFKSFSDIKQSYLLSISALVILLIACANFINLSTARATGRSKEVGVRKVIGAKKEQLFRQFVGESVIISFLSLSLSIVLLIVLLPVFNDFVGKQLSIGFSQNLTLLLFAALLTTIVGLISGTYPAVILSSMRPQTVLKGTQRTASFFGMFLRKGLIVFQAALSVLFISGTLIVFTQLDFLKTKDIGYENENILSILLPQDYALEKRYDEIRNEVTGHPNIFDMTGSFYLPVSYGGFLKDYHPVGFSKDETVKLAEIWIGDNFFDLYDIEFLEGVGFSREDPSVNVNTVILNEKAVKLIGWESAVGQQIDIKGEDYIDYEKTGLILSRKVGKPFTVIGVIKDAYFGSLKDELKPMMFICRPEMSAFFTLKISPNNSSETISFLQDKWKEYAPEATFRYYFHDEKIDANYKQEAKMMSMFRYISAIAILITCLGLFGMISFSAEKRVKEIGIRKTLGASVSNIYMLLLTEFGLLVLIANLFAWPVAYYFSKGWLEDFAYRANIGPEIYLSAGVMAVAIVVITTSHRAYKAAKGNPVDALRSE